MPTVEETGRRVESLLAALSEAGPQPAEHAEALVRALVELYGAGLSRVLELAAEQGPALVDRLTADPLLAGLLVLHDLHPVPVERRVRQALDRVRPMLGRHAGDVELVAVSGSQVRLRLAGSCHGCPSSASTVTQAIETAVTAAAPEIEQVTVDGVAPEPEPPLLQIGRPDPHPYAGSGCPAGEPAPVPAAAGGAAS